MGIIRPGAQKSWSYQVKLYLTMLFSVPPYFPSSPLSLFYAKRLQNLAGGIHPQRPDHEERRIREAVARILSSIFLEN
jgi:hypothetical protein